jgi:hypothetical protein
MGATNAQTLTGIYAPMAPDYEEIWAPLLRPYGLRLLEMLPLERRGGSSNSDAVWDGCCPRSPSVLPTPL